MEEPSRPAALEKVYDEMIDAWIRALSLKDRETAGETERVAQMAVFIAKELGVPEQDLAAIRRGALLHDIGKLGIPDSILKKADPLTEEEYHIIQRHVQYAREILEPIPFFKPVMEVILYHHERWDGAGYPHGLKGEEIPQPAQIVAVAGMWDALLSERPYRPAFSEEEAMKIMHDQRGKMFNPRVADAFLQIISSSI